MFNDSFYSKKLQSAWIREGFLLKMEIKKQNIVICVHTYIHIHVYIHIHTHIHTHTHRGFSGGSEDKEFFYTGDPVQSLGW